jgi:hypothetical protein
LGSSDQFLVKNALQDLCKLYRQGFRVHPEHRFGVEATIVGLIHVSDDAKVRRWALNALARLGQYKECKSALHFALSEFAGDGEVVAAGLAALYKLSPNPREEMRKLAFPGQTIALAALQHVPAVELDLSSLPVIIDTADAETIKLGLVVVGLGRAPSNMFDPDHSNAAIVRAIGNHHDPTVSQYSVWAITENPDLGVRDLGVDIKAIEALPDNVRAWVYKLLAMDAGAGQQYAHYIEHGAKDGSTEVRAGLAEGLRNTFADRLVPIILEWFTLEPHRQVRQLLTDHLIAQADKSPAYRENAVQAYTHEHLGSAARERMQATAAGSPLFGAFKRIDYSTGGDLFSGGLIMNQSNSFSIGDNAQIGALSGSGTATNSGTVDYHYSPQTIEMLNSRLSDAESYVRSLEAPEAACAAERNRKVA